MAVPKNSIPMVGGKGPFGYIDMGGMFTVLKVRDGITTYDDPGWYEHPPGTVADAATAEELRGTGSTSVTLRRRPLQLQIDAGSKEIAIRPITALAPGRAAGRQRSNKGLDEAGSTDANRYSLRRRLECYGVHRGVPKDVAPGP